MIEPMPIFNTPESQKDLLAYCESFPAGPQRVAVLTVMGMTWNLCAKLTKIPVESNE